MKGLVIKNTGSWYQVKTDDGQFIECKIKGNFRLKGIRSTNPVAVGDRVQIILNQEGTAFINEIEDRKNYIIRRSSNLSKQSHILAANLDQCMLVVTVNYPETSTIFITRKIFFYGVLTILPAFLLHPLHPDTAVLLQPAVLFNLLFLAVLASLICYVLWNVVLKQLGTVRASNYIYLNPLVTMIASFLILDEKITLVALGGAACIVCGVYWAEKK